MPFCKPAVHRVWSKLSTASQIMILVDVQKRWTHWGSGTSYFFFLSSDPPAFLTKLVPVFFCCRYCFWFWQQKSLWIICNGCLCHINFCPFCFDTSLTGDSLIRPSLWGEFTGNNQCREERIMFLYFWCQRLLSLIKWIFTACTLWVRHQHHWGLITAFSKCRVLKAKQPPNKNSAGEAFQRSH